VSARLDLPWPIRVAYPRWFLDRYGDDLVLTWSESLREASTGPLAAAAWWARNLVDVAASGLRLRLGSSLPGPDPGRDGRSSLLGEMFQDLRYAARMLARQPGFALVAVLTLALGIGANVAIFSVVDAVLLADLPYHDPQGLYRVWDEHRFSRELFQKLEGRIDGVRGPSAYSSARLTLMQSSGDAVELDGARVTAGHFALLGTPPAMGRPFVEADSLSGAKPVALLSYAAWQTRFGGAADIVGRELGLSGAGAESRTIVGVMPRGHECIVGPCEVWVPLDLDPSDEHVYSEYHFLKLVGRLEPGAEAGPAAAALQTVARRLRADEGLSISEESIKAATLTPLLDTIVGPYRTRLTLLFVAVGIVLLIACSNVAHLLLARSEARRREIAVRSALGARRSRLVRQLLTEGLLLGVAGSIAGLLAAQAVLGSLIAQLPSDMPRVGSIDVDPRGIAFALLAAVVSSVLFSLVPALRLSAAKAGDVVHAERGSSGAARSWNNWLIVAETGAAVALVAGAGLMIRSIGLLHEVDPGFRVDDVLTVKVSAPLARYPEEAKRIAFFEQCVARVAELPGVRSAAAIQRLPLSPGNSGVGLLPFGTPEPRDGVYPTANYRIVTPNYFETMGIPVRGRDFSYDDRAETPGVGIVNQSAAAMLWPGEDAVGKRIAGDGEGSVWFTVVGVVPDVLQHGLNEGSRPEVYVPLPQEELMFTFFIVARASDPEALAPAAREAVLGVDGHVPVSRGRSMGAVVAESLSRVRFVTELLGLFAFVALALGVIGVYGVTAYSVSRRTREIGLRLALGASRASVVRFVMRGGLLPVAAGSLLGLLAAASGARLLGSLLYGVGPGDPMTLGAVTATLFVTAGIATYVPALRAARVDPAQALRSE